MRRPDATARLEVTSASIRRSASAHGSIGLPSVPLDLRLDGNVLRYRSGVRLTEGKNIRPTLGRTEGMLDRFRQIEDGAGVLAFASRFGVLGICARHGLPSTHGPLPRREMADVKSSPSQRADVPLYDCLPCGWPDVAEPVKRWLHFARQTRALLSIAAALHQAKRPSAKDWAVVLEDVEPAEDRVKKAKRYAKDANLSRKALTASVDQWLLLAGSRPKFHWPESAPQPLIELQNGTVGVLAMQLAFAITKAHDLAVCSGCGQAYMRLKRKAQSGGRRNYCLICRKKGIPERDRKLSEAIRLREKRLKPKAQRAKARGKRGSK